MRLFNVWWIRRPAQFFVGVLFPIALLALGVILNLNPEVFGYDSVFEIVAFFPTEILIRFLTSFTNLRMEGGIGVIIFMATYGLLFSCFVWGFVFTTIGWGWDVYKKRKNMRLDKKT